MSASIEVPVTKIRLVDRLFLLGPPGVGKTEVVRQLAQEEARAMGRRFVDLRETGPEELDAVFARPEEHYLFLRVVAPHVFPEDLAVPSRREGYVEFLPPRAVKAFTLKNIAGVLFIDELTNVQRADQLSMYYSIILEHEAAWDVKLSPLIKVVVAGNEVAHSSVANLLPAPLVNRLYVVKVAPPSVDEWVDYMDRRYGNNWDRTVGAFLKVYPQHFFSLPKEAETLEPFPTPRAWSQLALDLKALEGAPMELVTAMIVGKVGREAGALFVATWRLKADAEKIVARILNDPSAASRLNASERAIAAEAFFKFVDLDKHSAAVRYLLKNDREFVVMAVLVRPRSERTSLVRALAKKYSKEFGEMLQSLASYL